MPWQERNAMEERVRFVSEAIAETGVNFSGLCRKYGVSRVTGYKWVKRFEESGSILGISEKSRRPWHSPNRVSETIKNKVLKLRSPDGWGARKISHILNREGVVVSTGTVHRILQRNGLIHQIDSTQQALSRFERGEPNELFQMDFKGPMGKEGNRNEPLTMIDDCSRYALAVRAVKNHTYDEVKSHFIDIFSEFGLPKEILTDHGTPWWSTSNDWGLSKLMVFLINQGIKLRFCRVRHPQTQGKVERFHRTLRRSVVKQGAPEQFKDWQPLYDGFRYRYNHIRPHHSLGMKTPAEVYKKSPRPFQPKPIAWVYPSDIEKTQVDSGGSVHLDGKRFFVCEALAGETVGLHFITNLALVQFRHMYVRELDVQTGRTRALVLPVSEIPTV